MSKLLKGRRAFLFSLGLLGSKYLLSPAFASLPPANQGVELRETKLQGVPIYQTIVNLKDSETYINIALANDAPQANSANFSFGDEDFTSLVNRHQGAVLINGTFFSKDEQKRVMGNMVAGGQFLKYSPWENYGTTLGMRANRQLEMITARVDGKPLWQEHWFSITCGPRLLRNGQIWLAPKTEGFQDPHIFDAGWRTAIGFNQEGDKLFLVTFGAIVTLEEEAQIMKAIGCTEAMNLDGGASRALAHRGQILVPPGRNLTNVIVVYDAQHPAPAALKASWQRFQQGERPEIPA